MKTYGSGPAWPANLFPFGSTRRVCLAPADDPAPTPAPAPPAPKPDPKPEPKPEPKPDPAPKPEPKPAPKPDPKPEPKPDDERALFQKERADWQKEREEWLKERDRDRQERDAEVATRRREHIRGMGLAVDLSDEHLDAIAPKDTDPRTDAGKAALAKWREAAGNARLFKAPVNAPAFDPDKFAEDLAGGKDKAAQRHLFGARHVKSLLGSTE